MFEIPLVNNARIGHISDNETQCLTLDVSGIIEEFGSGTFAVMFRRSQDSAAYPVPSGQIEVDDDGVLYVTLTSAETAYAGLAAVQIMYTRLTQVLMSAVYMVRVEDSLPTTSTVPSPWQNWVDQLYAAMEKEPYIGANGHWWTWDNVEDEYVDTEVNATGDAAGFGTPTASVDANVGTPSVTITATGEDTAKVFDFAFHNLKGETGEQGEKGDTGDCNFATFAIDATTGHLAARWSQEIGDITFALNDNHLEVTLA